jgi:hypothetical protein
MIVGMAGRMNELKHRLAQPDRLAALNWQDLKLAARVCVHVHPRQAKAPNKVSCSRHVIGMRVSVDDVGYPVKALLFRFSYDIFDVEQRVDYGAFFCVRRAD